jgi:hypothetical protein
MWPNITVTVERMPSACEASMISTQGHGKLVGADPLAHPVMENLSGGPGRGAEPGLPQPLEYLARRQAAHVAHVRDLHRRIGVEMDVRRDALGHAQPVLVVLEPPVRVDARLHAELGGAELDRLLNPTGELFLSVLVGVGRAPRLAEAAEGAADHAHVGDIDVAIDHERHRLARQLAAQLIRG